MTLESLRAIRTMASCGFIRSLYLRYSDPSPASLEMVVQAASMSIGPICLLPLKVISPCITFSPLLWQVGISPRYAANCFSLWNRLTSYISVKMHIATVTPMPGTVVSRSNLCLYLSVWLIQRIIFVASSNVLRMVSTCRMSKSNEFLVDDSSVTSSFSHLMKALDQRDPGFSKRLGS